MAKSTSSLARRADAKKLHVAFIGPNDPGDVRSFSGVLYFMVQALQAEMPDIEIVRRSRPRGYSRVAGLVKKWTKGGSDPYYWRPLNQWLAWRLLARWRGRRQLVISVVNSTLTAQLARRVPTIHISDATFALMRDFYAEFTRLDEPVAAAGETAEQDAIIYAAHASFSSEWAARSAIDHYGASPEKVSVISWGCNLPHIVSHAFVADSEGPCRLLFIGGNWHRKGGDLVIDTVRLLEERGVVCEIDVVGAPPPQSYSLRSVFRYHGFLSKAVPAESDRLHALYRDAGFLFLPTRQDCTPMTFAEANAYGTPGMTRDVGGVGGVVSDSMNGRLLATDAGPAEFADAIEQLWSDRAKYRALRLSSRIAYENRLNWRTWAQALRGIIDELEPAI